MKNAAVSRIVVIATLLLLGGCSKAAMPEASSTSPAGNTDSASTASTGPSTGTGTALAPPSGASVQTTQPPLTLRAGTTFVVTADQAVSSSNSVPGDHFAASLAAPVRINGTEVIPSGARVTGVVTDVKSAGKFKGNAEITVTIASISVHGRHYAVKTSSITEAGKGRGKRTAVGAGGGAAVGALIGAIAGGGKGAAIGAGAGAGAGTVGAAYTGDRDIQIDAETKLTFKLKQSLEISGK